MAAGASWVQSRLRPVTGIRIPVPYDLVVIGAGTAASAADTKVAAAVGVSRSSTSGIWRHLRALAARRDMLGKEINGKVRIVWPAVVRLKRSKSDVRKPQAAFSTDRTSG